MAKTWVPHAHRPHKKGGLLCRVGAADHHLMLGDETASRGAPLVPATMKTPEPAAGRHLVLLTFCLHNFFQCFCFMDFTTDEDVVTPMLNMNMSSAAGAAELDLLYYGGFAATLPAMLVSLWLLLKGYDRVAGLVMSVLIVLGAWLRYAAAVEHSYAYALLSTVSLGLAGGVIFTSFTFLPARWFPEEERAFATALAVQSNYAGWAVGCLNPLLFIGDTQDAKEASMVRFLLVQGIITTLLLPLQIVVSARAPPGADAAEPDTTATTAAEPDKLGVSASLHLLATRPQYVIHSVCYAVLGSVGYAVTGVVNTCFSASGADFSANETMGLNVAFIVAGVLTGVVSGKVVPERAYGTAVRVLFAVGTAGLCGVQVLLLVASGANLSHDTMLVLLVLLMIVSGAGSLGFINVGMRVAVAASHPAEEIYAGSVIEFFLLALATALGMLTILVPPKYTFVFFSVPAILATVGIFACARFDQRRSSGMMHDGLLSVAPMS